MKTSNRHLIGALLLALLSTMLNRSTSAPTYPVCDGTQTISVSPTSLIVPIGTQVEFECTVSQCQPDEIVWTKDGIPLLPLQHCPDAYDSDGVSYRRTFVANESISNISCQYILNVANSSAKGISNFSTLQVITDCSLASNIDVQFRTGDRQSDNTLDLQWRPACLWSGHNIDKFNISVGGRSDDGHINTTILRYNATQNLSESLNFTVDNLPSQDLTCTELSVNIMAFDRDQGWLCNAVTDTTQLFPLSLDVFNNESLNTRVFCRLIDETTVDILVKVDFEVPRICSYQKMEYTIKIYSVPDNSTIMVKGPFEYAGSDSRQISQEIDSGLIKTMNYSVEVHVNLSSHNELITSERLEFDTYSCHAPPSLSIFSRMTILTFSCLIILLFLL